MPVAAAVISSLCEPHSQFDKQPDFHHRRRKKPAEGLLSENFLLLSVTVFLHWGFPLSSICSDDLSADRALLRAVNTEWVRPLFTRSVMDAAETHRDFLSFKSNEMSFFWTARRRINPRVTANVRGLGRKLFLTQLFIQNLGKRTQNATSFWNFIYLRRDVRTRDKCAKRSEWS